eukprot:3354371-Pyramimonas_sp.AAC.1
MEVRERNEVMSEDREEGREGERLSLRRSGSSASARFGARGTQVQVLEGRSVAPSRFAAASSLLAHV